MLLQLASRLSDSITDLAQRCRKLPHVPSAVRGTDICKHTDRVTVEMYLDVEFQGGGSYTYWIEVSRRTGWDLQASLSRNEKHGQDKLFEYASSEFETLGLLSRGVDDLVARLSKAEFDLGAAATLR